MAVDLQVSLVQHGFGVVLGEGRADLAIVGVLDDGRGAIRDYVPTIVILCRDDSLASRCWLWEHGAADVLVPPVYPREAIARIRARLWRFELPPLVPRPAVLPKGLALDQVSCDVLETLQLQAGVWLYESDIVDPMHVGWSSALGLRWTAVLASLWELHAIFPTRVLMRATRNGRAWSWQ